MQHLTMTMRALGLVGGLTVGCVLDSDPVGNEPSGSGSAEGSESAETTDVSTTDISATDTAPGTTGVDTGTDTDGPSLACDSPAPNAFGGAYRLELGDFPGADDFDLDLDLDCTITGVGANSEYTQWQLMCDDDDGNPHAVEFDIAIAHDGPDGLEVLVGGDAQLRVNGAQDFGGIVDGPQHATSLAVSTVALLGPAGEVYGFFVEGPGPAADVVAPVEITLDRDACGVDPPLDDPDYDLEDRDMAVTVTVGDASMTLLSGQWASMAIDNGGDTDMLTVDVLEARAVTCCHSTTWVRMVGRASRASAGE